MPNVPQKKLTDRYDREACAYRDLWAPVLEIAGLKLVRELAGARPKRILDVGTGVGSLLPHLETAFPDAFVLGVDRSAGMLAQGPRRFPRAVMDATQLGVSPASLDLVLLVFMLFHLERPEEGLREARRVLADGGRVGCLTWGEDLESTASRIWNECLDAHGAAEEDPTVRTRHDPVNTPEKMETLLRLAGFTSLRCRADELVSFIDPERLIRLKTSLGSSKVRYDGLAPAAREACAKDARRRMAELSSEDFVARGRVVVAVASV